MMNNKIYNVFRNLLLVKKLDAAKTSSGIYLPENKGTPFVRLKVLAVGPDVKENISAGMIVLAQNTVEQISKDDASTGIINSDFVVMEETNNGAN